MSEHDGYEPGVPCWIAAIHPDPDGAASFYAQLLSWEMEDLGDYRLCRLRGRDVAAVVSQGAVPRSLWMTCVWVGSADDSARKAVDAGGSVVSDPAGWAGGGRVAILADPSGAVVGAWQPGERRGAQVVNEPGAWAWSQLTTSDPERAKAFYGAVFGWETDTFELGENSITMWRVPGYVGGEPEQPVARDVVAGMIPAGGDDVPPHWNVDFWVDDVDRTAERAAALGGTVVIAPFDTPISRTAALADPQGATFTATTITIGQ
jgi:uncharacterized protein